MAYHTLHVSVPHATLVTWIVCISFIRSRGTSLSTRKTADLSVHGSCWDISIIKLCLWPRLAAHAKIFHWKWRKRMIHPWVNHLPVRCWCCCAYLVWTVAPGGTAAPLPAWAAWGRLCETADACLPHLAWEPSGRPRSVTCGQGYTGRQKRVQTSEWSSCIDTEQTVSKVSPFFNPWLQSQVLCLPIHNKRNKLSFRCSRIVFYGVIWAEMNLGKIMYK